MKIYKYNSSLDDDTCFYDATLQLSKDGKSIIIINKRPIVSRKFIGTTDPKEVLVATNEYKIKNELI